MKFASNLDDAMQRFSLASRELFNTYFHVANPYENDGWVEQERYRVVLDLLFCKMVLEPAGIKSGKYGESSKEIAVLLRHEQPVPIMINREINGGYWDHPVTEVTPDVQLAFSSFFDWDLLEYRDHQYVRVKIEGWPSHPEVVGKDGLIERRLVRFSLK